MDIVLFALIVLVIFFDFDEVWALFIGFVVFVIMIILIITIYIKSQTENVNVMVTDKEKIISNSSEGGTKSTYMIYTDKTTYTLSDSIIGWNFDTSDDYGKIKKGTCYNLYVRGIRVSFLSRYQNIEKIKEIKCEGK